MKFLKWLCKYYANISDSNYYLIYGKGDMRSALGYPTVRGEWENEYTVFIFHAAWRFTLFSYEYLCWPFLKRIKPLNVQNNPCVNENYCKWKFIKIWRMGLSPQACLGNSLHLFVLQMHLWYIKVYGEVLHVRVRHCKFFWNSNKEFQLGFKMF